MKTLTGYQLSEFLSLILRHRPETIQLTLDAYGYAKIGDEYKCSSCNTGLFRIDKPTSITFASSDWP